MLNVKTKWALALLLTASQSLWAQQKSNVMRDEGHGVGNGDNGAVRSLVDYDPNQDYQFETPIKILVTTLVKPKLSLDDSKSAVIFYYSGGANQPGAWF